VNRKDWPRHGDYEGTLSDPANTLGALAGKAQIKYCEVKAVVGGTTAIQGSAKMAYPYEGWLVRNVEYETFKTGKNTVYQSALPLKNAAEYAKNRKRMEAGNAFIYHLSEGTEPVLLEEYELARKRKILPPRFCGIHCTALGEPQFEQWERIVEQIDGQEDVEGRRTARSSGRRSRTCGATGRPPTWCRRGIRACASASAPTGRRRARRTCSAS
jgi:hypothetical protein